MRNFLRNIFLASSVLVAANAPAHADQAFDVGSLILPTSATFQNDCGSVAVYGLVYNVLRANAWLEANRWNAATNPGSTVCKFLANGVTPFPASESCKIELHYSYRETKKSPNRCTPTNQHVGAPYPAGPTWPASPTPLHSDPVWNDGCDFEVTVPPLTAGPPPVSRVNAVSAVAPYAPTLINATVLDTSTKTAVFPRWTARSIVNTPLVPATDVDTVRYYGGPFVIKANDATTFLRLISGTLTTPTPKAITVTPPAVVPPVTTFPSDSSGNSISFAPFAPFGAAPACTFGTSNGGQVIVHRANAGFTAPVAKAFSAAPPRLALLATTQGTSSVNITIGLERDLRNTNGATDQGANLRFRTSADPHNFAVGNTVVISGVQNPVYNGTYVIVALPSSSTFEVVDPTGIAITLPSSGRGRATRYSGATKVGPIITITTTSPHGRAIGNTVAIAGVDYVGYDGTWVIATTPTTTSFTIDTTLLPAGPLVFPSSGNGDMTFTPPGAITKKVSDGILQVYLRNAGLQFVGAGGCPPGSTNIANPVKCPVFPGGPRGQIYDTFDIADVSDVISPTKLDPAYYKMIWTPHWETKSTDVIAPTIGEQRAIAVIDNFLEGQTGLMAECHSIHSFEGGFVNGAAPNNTGHATSSNSSGLNRSIATGQFQTCVGAAGVCSGASTPFGFNVDVINPDKDQYWPNCSDPTQPVGSKCTYFGFPGDAFSQTAEYSWNNRRGSVQNYVPRTVGANATTYKPGVVPLIGGVMALNQNWLDDPVAARAMITADYATRNSKDDTPTKGNVLYMAGHDVSGVVSGTKVILQTLLLLGEPPIVFTTEEVSRSSPIISMVGSPGVEALIQGSFERVTPAGSPPPADLDADIPGFQFPHLLGHLHAVATADVVVRDPDPTIGAQKIAALTDVFDVADVLDADSYAGGCAADGFGADSGKCRTVFTHTAGGLHPPNVSFATASADATLLAAINTNGGAITLGGGFPTFLSRIIRGFDDGGVFEPRLGGVDRSVIAAIGPSAVAAPSRPKMIYFGAADGMLHAVCAVVAGPCDVLGRELWAFVPRLQLPYLRKNTARVDGSPRVLDVFADLGQGSRSFRTLLVFQTASGTPGAVGREPSMTAMDVTDPTNPRVVWDFPLPGHGLIVNVGRVRVGATNKYIAFAQTNTPGTAGNVVTAVDVETGTQIWKTGGPALNAEYLFAITNRVGGTTIPPVTGMPGGAVGVDTIGAGNVTDVLFGTLYGDMWQVDAATGVNRYGSNPLFRFTTDQHPFGAPLTIFESGMLYALGVSGGYADQFADTLWSANTQYAVAVKIGKTPYPDPGILNESSPAPDVKWTLTLDGGDKSYSQATVVGGEVFITTDSLDANALDYGTAAGDSGRVYKVDLAGTGPLTSASAGVTTVVVAGGAGSVATSGANVFNVSKDRAERLGVSMNTDGTAGVSVSTANVARVTRRLWLRTL